jgi:hypothetical protein
MSREKYGHTITVIRPKSCKIMSENRKHLKPVTYHGWSSYSLGDDHYLLNFEIRVKHDGIIRASIRVPELRME